MNIESLQLKQCRNINHLIYQPHPHMNILVGDNGQGKTNILECIDFLSTTRSCRVKDYKLMIQHEKESCSIEVDYNHGSHHHDKLVIFKQGKTIYHDYQLIKKSSDYIGNFLSIIFLPSEVTLFDNTPKYRRSWIDQEIVKIDKDYLNQLIKCNHYLKDRNACLKNIPVDNTYLEILTRQLNAVESVIIEKRNNFIQNINLLLNQYYQSISDETNTVCIEYKTCVNTMDNFESQLLDIANYSLNDDIRYQTTNYGCQKDDFIFLFNHQNVKEVCSQGQKRSIILAFKLALSHYFNQLINQYPVLLLDDVLSELDIHHQQQLLKNINENQQLFITTNHYQDWFKEIGKVYEIKNGNIIERT